MKKILFLLIISLCFLTLYGCGNNWYNGNGKKDWTRIYRYKNWQVESKGNYINGYQDWKRFFYYENWQIKGECNFEVWTLISWSGTCLVRYK